MIAAVLILYCAIGFGVLLTTFATNHPPSARPTLLDLLFTLYVLLGWPMFLCYLHSLRDEVRR